MASKKKQSCCTCALNIGAGCSATQQHPADSGPDQPHCDGYTPIKLTIRNFSSDSDWWSIERADHNNETWWEPDKYGRHMMKSCRIVFDVDVEGTSLELCGIAKAIKDRDAYYSRRCAVEIKDDIVYLWSPRNSTNKGMVSLDAADVLADEIIQKFERDK